MNKQEFLSELENHLAGLPQEDINKSLDYYSEIIDDSIEDGVEEQEAVDSLGSVYDIASQIMLDIPLKKLVKAKIKPNRALRVWEIILIVLGSPIWLSLLIALFSVVLAVYISIWSVVISLYAVVLSMAVFTLVIAVGIFVSLFKGLFLNTLIFLSLTLVCAGLSTLLFIGINYFAKGMIYLSKLGVKGIKCIFVGRSAK